MSNMFLNLNPTFFLGLRGKKDRETEFSVFFPREKWGCSRKKKGGKEVAYLHFKQQVTTSSKWQRRDVFIAHHRKL